MYASLYICNIFLIFFYLRVKLSADFPDYTYSSKWFLSFLGVGRVFFQTYYENFQTYTKVGGVV